MQPSREPRQELTPIGSRTRSIVAALTLSALAAVTSWTAAPPAARAQDARPGADRPPILQLVESAPVETTLDRPEIPNARDEWPLMIGNATASIDWAAFYVSGESGSSLDQVLVSLADAAERGVEVRIVSERVFYETYPEILHALNELDNIEVRLIDYRALQGGVMHAKYVVVDGDEAFIGSQNFDWRALDHIVEMGLHVRLPAYARALLEVFERDWARGYLVGTAPPEPTAGDETGDVDDARAAERDRHREAIAEAIAAGLATPAMPERTDPIAYTSRHGDLVTLYPAFSPSGDLPDAGRWDLPLIVELLDAARDTVNATMLTYKPVDRDGSYWPVLENALHRAAARGVIVRLLVADWGKRAPTIDYLQSLQSVPGIEVRLVTIPEASRGFIPYARVTHAKYLTADGRRFWLGTSNWERSYFETSRNVGLVADDARVCAELDRSFGQLWSSAYAYPVDPCADYEPPRIGE